MAGANPVIWGVAAAAIFFGGTIAVMMASVAIAGSGGSLENEGEGDHHHVASAPRRGSSSGGPLLLAEGGEVPGPPWCGPCSHVLVGHADIPGDKTARAVKEWRRGITRSPVPGIDFCPVRREGVDKALTDAAWGDGRKWKPSSVDPSVKVSHRFHSGTDVYKKGSLGAAARVDVLAMTDGTLWWGHGTNRHNIYLDTDITIDSKPLRIAYFHIDNDIGPQQADWRGGRFSSNDAVLGGEVIGSISTTAQGGMDNAHPHVHIGFIAKGEEANVDLRGRGPGNWDPWPTIERVCEIT